jgi:hypothetical protein
MTMAESLERKWRIQKGIFVESLAFIVIQVQVWASGPMKSTFAISTMVSVVAFCFLMVIWPVSYHMDLSRGLGSGKLIPSDSIPIVPDYRLGFERGRVWLYNYDIPYRGSIVWISSTNDPAPIIQGWGLGEWGYNHSIRVSKTGKLKLSERACDLPGVYFRRFWDFNNSPPYTTLEISLWYPVLLSAILPSLWVLRKIRVTPSKS